MYTGVYTLLKTFKRAKFLLHCTLGCGVGILMAQISHKRSNAETVLTLGVAMPATALAINIVILFERVVAMIAIALRHLCFGGDSPWVLGVIPPWP